MSAVKRLSPEVVRDIEMKNQARRDNGLSSIRIKIRTCVVCGQLFESAGNRTCGCTTQTNSKEKSK